MRNTTSMVKGLLVVVALALGGCVTHGASPVGSAGTLLIIGGGLDNDTRPVWQRFVALAQQQGPANILIVSAATGDEEVEITDKTEALRVWAPGVKVGAIRRATSTEETVAAVDSATALLFTGGDQKRITARYRPGDQASPESQAMRRLLARGGVIAGCSAGDAMMGTVMLLSGGSATALGIAPKAAGSAEDVNLGPRLGAGMGFLPWAITDSHFFERDRVGRLVAALEESKQRLGLAVGEDGCVEVDLATGMVTGVGVSESLLVDTICMKRDGLRRTNVLARILAQGDRISLTERLESTPQAMPAGTAGAVREVPVVEPGQNRQLASWRLFRTVGGPGGGAERLLLDGWQITAWPAGAGEVVFEVGPR
jgi:cyanophycinase